MSDCMFRPFVITARKEVGDESAVRKLLFEIANELSVECIIQAADRTLTVKEDFDGNSDLLVEVLGKYAQQLEDTKLAYSGDTENNGHWFWRIKDGKYQETGSLIVPDEEEWHDEESHDQMLEIKKGVGVHLTKSEAEALVDGGFIYFCGEPDCDFYHVYSTVTLAEVNEALRSVRGY